MKAPITLLLTTCGSLGGLLLGTGNPGAAACIATFALALSAALRAQELSASEGC